MPLHIGYNLSLLCMEFYSYLKEFESSDPLFKSFILILVFQNHLLVLLIQLSLSVQGSNMPLTLDGVLGTPVV